MYHVDHRGSEIELEIEAVEIEGVFTDALLALGDVYADATAARGRPTTHAVVVGADDLPGLLAAWVARLVELAENEDFVPERVEKLRLAGSDLNALVAGERSIPRDLIAGVASDRVGMRRLQDGAWSAAIVLATRS